MNITFALSSLEQLQGPFQAYLSTLSAVYDNYLEDHILGSCFYHIHAGSVSVGYCAIWEGHLLTQFYLHHSAWRQAQEIFRAMLHNFPLQAAYVPSCDEAMLSICLDFHKAVELQAYSFRYRGVAVRPAEYPRGLLRLARPDEWPGIEKRTDGFFDLAYYEKKKAPSFLYEIYELAEDGHILGYGLRESGRIFTGYHATGMYTMPAQRKKNVGRSILLHLRALCEAQHFHALPACWYHNLASKRTLESAGYVAQSRLLKIHFS